MTNLNMWILPKLKKLDPNIKSKSSNNTYLNIIEILFYLFHFFLFVTLQVNKYSLN